MALPELHIIIYCIVLLANCMFPLNTYSLGQPSFSQDLIVLLLFMRLVLENRDTAIPFR